MPFSRSGAWVPAALFLLLVVLVVPSASAQENYPPSPPPGQSVEVDCGVDAVGAARQVQCEGRAFAPGTEVTLEVFAAGGQAMAPLAVVGPASLFAQDGGNQPVASGSSTVRPDGTFEVSARLDCDYDRSKARAVVDGEAQNGRHVTHSETVDVPSCEVLGLGLSGEVDGADGLALTGRNLLILLLVAAALIALGALLVRNRRRQEATPAA